MILDSSLYYYYYYTVEHGLHPLDIQPPRPFPNYLQVNDTIKPIIKNLTNQTKSAKSVSGFSSPPHQSQMGRKPNDSEPTRCATTVLLFMGLVSCTVVYIFMSAVMRPTGSSAVERLTMDDGEFGVGGGGDSKVDGECCNGIESFELWGAAVKWGSDFKVNSSKECCNACKAMCTGNHGPCLCDTWVFCGNKKACGDKFGECWLKKQKDTLAPDRQEAGNKIMWTSGIVFGKGEGIVALETEFGAIHVKLLPECSPHSIFNILELLGLRHCAGCQFFRAETRGEVWDTRGDHIKDASFGPPYALVQGTLGAQGTTFDTVPSEFCPEIRRGSVAWVGSGPEFFISLANHQEWKKSYTVFGYVLPEDMEIVEKIAQLPTKLDVWTGVNVTILENPVPLRVRRIKSNNGDLNLNS